MARARGTVRRRAAWTGAAVALGIWLGEHPTIGSPPAAVQEPPRRAALDLPGLPDVTQGSLVRRSPIAGRDALVPLEHTEVELDVRGLVVAATVTQRFRNDGEEPIEAVYVFPLPHEAAVYDMEVRVGERVIRSAIRERAEARRSYEAARSRGRRAALLEQERPNLFTASLANLAPGDRIEVRIRYVEPLRFEEGRARLVFPMVVGPRYVPGRPRPGEPSGTGWAADTDAVPDASRVTPPVRHPGSRSGHDISLGASLDLGTELASIASPSHDVAVERSGPGRARVKLRAERTLPNRDFVLELERAPVEQAETTLFLSRSEREAETHFMLVAYPPAAAAAERRVPLELVFVIDVSGSMRGTSIGQAREALLYGLARLRPGDRFGIVAYDDRCYAFRPAPVDAAEESLAAARDFVAALSAGGGTEMLPALRSVMALPPAEPHLRAVVLLTDGALGDEDEVFAAVEGELGAARLFTVAIGSAPNHHLAARLAEFGRGSFTHVAEAGEVRVQMGTLLDAIESPVLTDLTLTFSGLAAEEVFPERIGDVYLGRPLAVYGRLRGDGEGSLAIEGRAGGERYRAVRDVRPAEASFHPGITTLWARQKVRAGSDEWRRARGEEERARWRARVVAAAVRYRLLTRFTSLVAVEERVVNEGGSPRLVRVPTEMPAGWSYQGVFGVNPATGSADAFLEALGLALLAAGALLAAAGARRRRIPA